MAKKYMIIEPGLTFLKKFQFSRQNIPTDEIYSGMEKDPNLAYYMEGDRLASEFAGELKSGQDISQEIFKGWQMAL